MHILDRQKIKKKKKDPHIMAFRHPYKTLYVEYDGPSEREYLQLVK
jgi:hypothetical protein